ncbi:MAG: VOC family protein [Clostridiales bacterium]|nr:VOC family protein [Clostridiales bacterium]
MIFRIDHTNINVTDIEASLTFYEKALGLTEYKRKTGDGYTLAFLKNEEAGYSLELTCLSDHPQKYDLGENESHIAFKTDDYNAAYKHHREMGCICFENKEMGLYFIEDPDGYWLEILSEKR